MLFRCTLIIIVLSLAFGFAYLNPVSPPEAPATQSWIKIDENGKTLGAWDGPWTCVKDPKTQLLWEVKSYAENIHDHQCSFSWFIDGKGAQGRGDCFVKGEATDTSELIARANKHAYCGSTSWRLPTEGELKTLIEPKARPGEPLIATDYFPYAKRGPYWTADTEQTKGNRFSSENEAAVAINFGDGKREMLPFEVAAFARLVSSSNPVHIPK